MAEFTRNQSPRSMAAALPQGQWLRISGRAVLSLALAGLFLWLLSERLAEVDLAAVTQALSGVSQLHWAGAILMTAISFWAVGHYDAVLHRYFATGLPDAVTRRAGICAIAVSQTLGLGVITGAILRWRMLPGQSLWQAARLTAAVALSFLAGWAVVTAVILLVLPAAPFKGAALAVALVAFGMGVTCLIAPRWGIRWPNGFTLGRLITLCAVDTLAAAAAFYLLCPDPLILPFTTLLPAFLLALGAGLATGTPGGLGAFEVTLLALLPMADPAPVLAAILAWRLTYYALPALLGAAVAIMGPRRPSLVIAPTTRLTTKDSPEMGLAAQGCLAIQPVGQGEWLVGRTGHVMAALFTPSAGASMAALSHCARTESRLPVLYKCTARLAASARAAGYTPLLIARDAWLCPQTYRLGTSARAGLRRKLRRAEAAGITVTCPDILPWPHLELIAAHWSKAHGGERGFSMGRYSRSYLSRQRVYVAWQNGSPVAFVSFHIGAQIWTLDLMRHAAALPNGTMHSLVQAAIDDAARANLSRLSLAAVPESAFHQSTRRTTRLLRAMTGEDGAGLAQFKSAFAPQWQRLYMAAPNRPCLIFAAASLARAILHPPVIEQDHAEYEFASAPNPWHRQG